jgi:hypothetical protein
MKNVIEGHEGFLFLTGGAHLPGLYSRGEKKISKQALNIFWNNQKWRQKALANRKIRHLHLIAPDKHNVCPEVFPEDIIVSVGKTFLQAAPTPGLAANVLYPVEELAADFRRNCSKVDTHFTPHGTGVICLALLRALAELEAEAELRRCLAMPETLLEPWTGDLGHRFNPPRTEPKISLKIGEHVLRYNNNLKGNNGIIDLYINQLPSEQSLGRVMLFGDSYGRQIASMLSHCAQEIMFLRTPYLHMELVNSAKPDLVITQNAERYLPSTLPDAERPVFFLMPFIKEDASVSISKRSASAISNFLSGRPFAAS